MFVCCIGGWRPAAEIWVDEVSLERGTASLVVVVEVLGRERLRWVAKGCGGEWRVECLSCTIDGLR